MMRTYHSKLSKFVDISLDCYKMVTNQAANNIFQIWLVCRVDFSLTTNFGRLKSTLLMSAIFGTKSANKRTFLLPKSDIPDFYTQSISDLEKSAKAGLFRFNRLAMT